MLEFLKFGDHCVISRDNGEKDDWDNKVGPEKIYEGQCLYQEGGVSFSRMFTNRNPVLFIPTLDVKVQINDSVVVTTEFGREIKSVVKIVRDVKLPRYENVRVTRIELKQAQGE